MAPRGMAVTPVGVVQNQQKECIWPSGPSDMTWRERALMERASAAATSRIEVDAALDGILEGIEEFSHLLVLWWPHRNRRKRTTPLQVRPMGRQDLPLVGVFATRSPVRPNCVLATVVRLVKRHGQTLEVTGLDAIDGSPIIDIKPLMPRDCPREELRVPGWLERVNRELTERGDEPGAR